MNLQDAFTVNISISFAGKQPPKKKKKKMVDAYESFLNGNWKKISRARPKVSNTFGSNA